MISLTSCRAPALPCPAYRAGQGIKFLNMKFLLQGRTGQGIRAGQVRKRCPVDVSGSNTPTNSK